MQISVTFTTDPELILRSYRACHPMALPIRWTISVSAVAAGIAMRSLYPAAVGFLFVVLLAGSVRWQLRRYLRGARRVTVAIGDDEYGTTGPEGITRSWPWSNFTAVERRGEFWVLHASSNRAVAFPAAALNEAQTAEFTGRMVQKGLLGESTIASPPSS